MSNDEPRRMMRMGEIREELWLDPDEVRRATARDELSIARQDCYGCWRWWWLDELLEWMEQRAQERKARHSASMTDTTE